MANSNKLKIDSYSKDLASNAVAENIQADSGKIWKFAKDVILKADNANTGSIKVGNRDRQSFPLYPTTDSGDEIRLSSIINRMSQSDKYYLEEIFVLCTTNGDDIHIMLIDPSDE